jgi:hypothetical protein
MSAVADAIEVYYRTTASDGTSSVEVREALSRAMKWVSTASRIDHDRQAAERQAARLPLVLDGLKIGGEGGAWTSASEMTLPHAG